MPFENPKSIKNYWITARNAKNTCGIFESREKLNIFDSLSGKAGNVARVIITWKA